MPSSRPGAPRAPSPTREVLVVDNRPFQNEAWAELHRVRKQFEKAGRDLHRHEETDTPAYQAWLRETFPTLVSALRDLHQEVANKGHRVREVQMMSAISGRSAAKLWREVLEEEAAETEEAKSADESTPGDEEDAHSSDQRKSSSHYYHADDEGETRRAAQPRKPAASDEAKDVYRRLVLRLHPDHAGKWTPAREKLWHEVQQAWQARDTDWLLRLEIEWEAATDTLSRNSSLSRLKRAIEEMHAARKDIERKLRRYRESIEWRFTLSVKKRAVLHRRIESELHQDLNHLKRQLSHLNAVIASWEKPVGRRARLGD